MTDHSASRAGTTLQGRYRLQRLLAEGAMGSVYLGERLGLSRKVAVKFLRADLAGDPSFVKRFETETRALGRLAHPNCVSLFDFGFDGAPYVVMDFVEGHSLRTLLQDGPLPAPRAVAITRQVLAALAHAHEQGIVHRDAKPENILLEPALGLGHDHVRVLDFGLSKLLDETSQVTAGMMIGTPSYMAPEQLQPGAVDARADVYACGVLLYEMLAGRNPFEGDSLSETVLAQRFMTPQVLGPGRRIPRGLTSVLGRALAKRPDDRYSSALQMKAALDSLAEPEATRPLTRVWQLIAREGPALLPGLRKAQAASRRAFDATARGGRALLAEARRSPVPARRAGAVALGTFVIAFATVFALTLSARAPERARPTPSVDMARATAPPSTTTAASTAVPPSSEVETALALARESFAQGRYGDGVDYFRFAARKDRSVRGNALLVDHVIDGLASERQAPRAEAFLRELGRDARPHVQNAARSHASARVRKRAQALLDQPVRRPFLRWVSTRPGRPGV